VNSSIKTNKKDTALIGVEVNPHNGDFGLTGLGIFSFADGMRCCNYQGNM